MKTTNSLRSPAKLPRLVPFLQSGKQVRVLLGNFGFYCYYGRNLETVGEFGAGLAAAARTADHGATEALAAELMTHLTNPWLLLLLAVIPCVLWLAMRRRPAYRVGSIDLFAQAATRSIRSRRWILAPVLRGIWLSLLVLALAGPQTPAPDAEIRRSESAVCVVLDVSGSMATIESTGSGGPVRRLDQARRVLRTLLMNSRSGLGSSVQWSAVAFASRPEIVSPATRNAGALLEMLDGLQVDRMDNRTNLGDAMALAVDQLRRQSGSEKVLLLLTDGANTYPDGLSPAEAARITQALGIRLGIVGLGAARTAASPSSFEAEQAQLRQWAEWTNGFFVPFRDPGDEAGVVDDLKTGVKGPVKVVGYRAWRGWLSETVLLAMTIWLLESILTRHWLCVGPR